MPKATSDDLSIKYRPRSIDHIIQPPIQRAMKNAVMSGMISQFYFFSGPRGTGKTSTARWLAAMMCCPNKSGYDPCGKCDVCNGVFGGSYHDVIEINAAQHTGKDVIEERVLSTLMHPAIYGDTKVYILDECHKLSDSAQSSLLKCLEEPPGHAMFIFCTTEPTKVIDTIIDRSIHFEFSTVSVKAIAERVGEVCDGENIAIDPGALEIIAQEARGSVRRAFKLIQKIATDKITKNDAEAVLGRGDSSAAIRYVGLVTKGKFREAISHVEEMRIHGKDIEGLFREALEVLSDVIREKAGITNLGRRCYSEKERDGISKLSVMLDSNRIRHMIHSYEQAIRGFRTPGVPVTTVATVATIETIAILDDKKG